MGASTSLEDMDQNHYRQENVWLKSNIQTMQWKLNDERKAKQDVTIKYFDLQKQFKNFEEKLLNSEDALANERRDYQKFRNTQERKHKNLLKQLGKSKTKIRQLTKENKNATEELQETESLKDDLLKAKETIAELEQVVADYQNEQKKNREYALLKELQATKIIEAYNESVRLKQRSDKIIQKSDYLLKQNKGEMYDVEIKQLKSENQILAKNLANVSRNKKKVENLEKNYVKMRTENNSYFNRLEDIRNCIFTLYQQVTIVSPSNFLVLAGRYSEELDEIEKTNFDDSCQNERLLLNKILNELKREKRVLQTIQESQHLLQ